MKSSLALCFLVACGSDAHQQAGTDAPIQPEVDAAVQISDAQVAPVTVKTVPPIANVPVYFQNADSTVVAKRMTDTNGEASAVMVAGGFATIVNALPDSAAPYYRMITWSGVKPGDVLEGNPGTGATSPVAPSTVTVTLPVVQGAKTYDLEPTCGNAVFTQPATNATTFTATISTTCATIDLMVLASNTAGVLLGSFTASDLAIVDGATMNLTANTYAAATTRTIEIDHYGASTLFGGTFVESKNGTVFFLGISNLAATDPVTTTQKLPAPPTVHRNVTWLYGSHAHSSPHFYQWGDDGAITADWTTVTPSFATALTYADRKISWTASSGGATATTYGIQGTANRASYGFEWNAFGAGDGSYAVTLPALPTDLADFTLTATDSFGYAVMAAYPGGYDALRLSIGRGEPYPPAGSASGTLSFTTYVP